MTRQRGVDQEGACPPRIARRSRSIHPSARRVARLRSDGFTLIELMIALVVSSLLVGMILAIFSRMSIAYRGQQQVAGVQQVLAAARAAIEFDAKQAGLGMAQGFTARPTGAVVQQPVQIANDSAGPDSFSFFYADPTLQAVVTDASAWPAAVTIDANPGFVPGDRVAVTSVDVDEVFVPGAANLAQYTTCVIEVGSVAGAAPSTVTFATDPPWGIDVAASHCAKIPEPGKTMIYRFVAHGYRIDTTTPERTALGPLQRSDTGGLLGEAEVWTELAYGFTDLQTALRVYEHADLVDTDGDGDPAREWYSGNEQDNRTAPNILKHPEGFLQMSISLVARTDREVEGVGTPATPDLTGDDPDHNPVGDHPSTVLPWAVPPLPGDPPIPGFIYRHTTVRVDFRNLGVGR